MREFSIDRLGELLAESPANTFWRHDIDVSPDAALQMAKLEAELGIVATFYVMTESPFYAPTDAVVLAMRLAALDHHVGWHIDPRLPSAYPADGLRVSWHCPTPEMLWRDFDGFESAYASRWEGRYVSDARGVFRGGDPEDIFDGEALQVALHPEWWFEPRWADAVPDDVYERFFHELKTELACV